MSNALKTSHRIIASAACAALAAGLLSACASVHQPRYDQAFDVPAIPIPPADGAIYHTAYDSGGLFGDAVAHNVGDTITVLLNESTTAQNKSATDDSKTTKDSLSAPSLLGFPMTFHGNQVLGANVNDANTFSGAGGSSQSDSLVGAIQVTVIKRLANGDLVVRGQTMMRLNQAQEYVRLQGVIRPIDISPQNTISSQQVADAQISYGQTGALNDANEPGLLSRFFNFSWLPF